MIKRWIFTMKPVRLYKEYKFFVFRFDLGFGLGKSKERNEYNRHVWEDTLNSRYLVDEPRGLDVFYDNKDNSKRIEGC